MLLNPSMFGTWPRALNKVWRPSFHPSIHLAIHPYLINIQTLPVRSSSTSQLETGTEGSASEIPEMPTGIKAGPGGSEGTEECSHLLVIPGKLSVETFPLRLFPSVVLGPHDVRARHRDLPRGGNGYTISGWAGGPDGTNWGCSPSPSLCPIPSSRSQCVFARGHCPSFPLNDEQKN